MNEQQCHFKSLVILSISFLKQDFKSPVFHRIYRQTTPKTITDKTILKKEKLSGLKQNIFKQIKEKFHIQNK
jgi:hypothetical protein